MYHILKVNHEQFEKTPKNDCICRSGSFHEPSSSTVGERFRIALADLMAIKQ